MLLEGNCGISLSVKLQFSKLLRAVRLRYPAQKEKVRKGFFFLCGIAEERGREGILSRGGRIGKTAGFPARVLPHRASAKENSEGESPLSHPPLQIFKEV